MTSAGNGGSILVWGFIILIVIVLAAIIYGIVENFKSKKRRAQMRQAEFEKLKRLAAEQAEKYQLWYNGYVVNNGIPDKSIVIRNHDINGVIFVHEQSKTVYLQGRTYNFSDIISCTFSDNATTVKCRVTAVTNAQTGSAIGRAIVGNIVGGSAGAIIGGTTGKRTTEFHQENDQSVL